MCNRWRDKFAAQKHSHSCFLTGTEEGALVEYWAFSEDTSTFQINVLLKLQVSFHSAQRKRQQRHKWSYVLLPSPLCYLCSFRQCHVFFFSLDAHTGTIFSSPFLVCIASDDGKRLEALQKWSILLNCICGAKELSAPPGKPQEDWKLNSNFFLISSQLLNLLQQNETHI